MTGAGTILQASAVGAAETIPNASSVTVNAGAVFQLGSGSGAETINALNGAGTVRTFNGGTFGSGLIVGSAGGSGAFSGALENGTAGNPLSLTKSGAGTQTLSGANTFTGGVIIDGGILNVNADAALGGSAGAVAIRNGATLQASGTVTSVRPFTLSTLAGGRIETNGQTVTLDTASTVAGTALEKTGAGTLNLKGTQTYDALTTSGGTTNIYTALNNGTQTSVITANATTNIYASQTLAALTIGDGVEVTFGDGLPFAPEPDKGGGLAALGAGGAVVPEPGALGLLLAGALGLLGQRRRA